MKNILIIQARQQAADHEFAAILTNSGLAEDDVDTADIGSRRAIVVSCAEENVIEALAHPGVLIAGDGGDLSSGTGHPRGAGTHARVLGVYVRELMDGERPSVDLAHLSPSRYR